MICTVENCALDACARFAGQPRCERHYWQDASPILRRLYRQGISPYTGERFGPELPEWWPIGIGVYTAPASSWPPDFGLLTCDTCEATWVGPRTGELCARCRQLGEHHL